MTSQPLGKRLLDLAARLHERVRAADDRAWAWIDRVTGRTAPPGTAAPGGSAGAAGNSPGIVARPAAGSPPRPRRPFTGWHLHLPLPGPALMFGIVVAVLVVDLVLWQRCGLEGCPDVLRLRAYQPNGAPVLYDRRGRPWGQLRPVDRVIVSIDSLPWYVPAAFVAVEDKRFYKHHGVDWPRVFGAALRDIRSGGYAQGFSTISMQLARNVWSDRIPAQQKTLRRKMLEIRVAMEIEHRFSKKEILELYLNNIYFGDGAYGIEAAARDYYHRSARGLSLQQAAMLAALPRAPALYDPRDHAERARQRRNLVLSLMSSGGFASPQLTAAAAAQPLGVADEPAPVPGQGIGRYFAELVRREMEAQFGEDLYRSRMKIVTTLDADAQRAAEQELEKQLRAIEAGELGPVRGPHYRTHRIPGEAGTDYLQGAVVVMDAHSGDLLALVGGRDFEDSRYNRAIQARRQTGSSFKPFVYGRAIQAGFPISQHLLDEPMTLMVGRTPWSPRDFGDRYRGDVTMREAITNSLNVPTVRLARAVGIPSVINFAHRVGLTAPIYNGPSAALGTAEVTPLELTRAYTAFATLGTRVEPRIVRRVVSADNQLLWEAAPPRQTPVLDPGVAYILTDMLRDVVERGTGTPVRDAGFQGPVAGKTGTTSDAADAWFVGYTPDVVATVWIGYDRRREIAHDATGGAAAAPVWGRMMRRLYARWPQPPEWQRPDNVASLAVDQTTGQTLQEGCTDGNEYGELFLTTAEPAPICPEPHVLGTPIPNIGGFLSNIWHAITGGRAPTPPSPPVVVFSTRSQGGPYDPVLGAPRVRMRAAPSTAGTP